MSKNPDVADCGCCGHECCDLVCAPEILYLKFTASGCDDLDGTVSGFGRTSSDPAEQVWAILHGCGIPESAGVNLTIACVDGQKYQMVAHDVTPPVECPPIIADGEVISCTPFHLRFRMSLGCTCCDGNEVTIDATGEEP